MARHTYSAEQLRNPSDFGSDEILNQGQCGPVFLIHGQENVFGSKVNWTAAIPEELTQESLNVIVPGFGGIKRSSRGLRTANAENGAATVSYAPARDDNQSVFHNLTAPQDVHVATIDAVINGVGRALVSKEHHGLPHRRSISNDDVVLIPHSMGGLSATPYALENMGRIRAVHYLAAAGFGDPTILSLVESVSKDLKWSIKNELLPLGLSSNFHPAYRNLARIGLYYASHLDRTVGEANSCLTEDICEDVDTLTNEGIYTTYDSYEHDFLIMPNENIARIVNEYRMRKGLGHLAPQVHPRTVADHIHERAFDPPQQPPGPQLIAA